MLLYMCMYFPVLRHVLKPPPVFVFRELYILYTVYPNASLLVSKAKLKGTTFILIYLLTMGCDNVNPGMGSKNVCAGALP